MPAMAMLHETDPRDDLLAQIGDLSKFDLFHNKVLCAIYKRPKVTAGGIALPDAYLDEDKHQGKIGLIVKLGSQAFKSDGEWEWPADIGLGDWVYYRVSDGWAISINKVDCRILEDTDIRGRVQFPDQVW